MSWKLQVAVGVLLLVLLGLQYRLWVGEGSLAEVAMLKRQIADQRAELEDLQERNATLQAEVDDLKEGLAAIEARARSELGLIRKDETYFQLVPPESRKP
ncbi:cell division protein FtsB [Thiosocius teredinicola]|uniref:cell division protein FtsB n=1 Tax=Thiosocius teredinicola TaxID=1973002 RepID=UPI00099110E7